MSETQLAQQSSTSYMLEPTGNMRVPAILYTDDVLLSRMEEDVLRQVANVASLPGIVKASMAMPDAHSGYGFPIGGVGAFDPEKGGVVSAGGVGFDISCGVRTILTGIHKDEVNAQRKLIADLLFQNIPAGLGVGGSIKLGKREIDRMLGKGAAWAVKNGYGCLQDLEMCEEGGTMQGAVPEYVSDKAKQRQAREMGTLGSGNHYLEVQSIDHIYDHEAAQAFGLIKDNVVVSIHCGSRGLGHQVATDYIRLMQAQASKHKLHLPDRDLACAPINSELGNRYLGAMRAAINCALANRQIITHLMREAFQTIFPEARMPLLYDVSHNTCREEMHMINNVRTRLFVHRKGATRALGPGAAELPQPYRQTGQPVLVGGSMGTASYVLTGTLESAQLSFSSACHGAGRTMSRKQAGKQFKTAGLISSLLEQGIEIRGHSLRGLAEEAPKAYKDVNRVIQVTHDAGLAKKVARLSPVISIKG
ncbi:RtcB family protein [Desulfonatronovibrio magnus]|uniref:RtcB family protein n=1 Tax=Desulfonatronovibrio magnus TaxID=698827 RepID=UPI0005EB5673|nr:RtcB family protein [Desulfonatronovibrio magnus]